MMRASSVTFVGVARFMGAVSSCRMLGVVTPSPKPNPSASKERAKSKPQEEHVTEATEAAHEENESCRFAGFSVHERPCRQEKKTDGEET
eukprot:3412174-Lingulodinium_polyedra.AAC.1